MTDEELEKVAMAATPGPWSTKDYCPDHVEILLPNGFSRIVSDPTVVTDYDARFIAAFNPATALALLERVRKAERPSHPTAEHAQRVVTALEEMLAPLSDGTLGNRDVVGRVSALLDRMTKAEDLADQYRSDLETAREAAEKNGAAYFKALERVRELEGSTKASEPVSDETGPKWCERPIRTRDGGFVGPCSLEVGHDYECEHWMGGRHPKPLPR